jgi:NADH-quinone oxidoreductase subunit K
MNSLTFAAVLVLSAGFLGIGLYGLLVTRNLIKLVIALQLLVKGALAALVAGGLASGKLELASSIAITVIVVDTVVAVLALAFALQVREKFGTLDVRALGTLKE